MKRQKCIPLDSRPEWNAALKGIKHAFAHTWENCYAMHLTTGLDTFLYCFDSDYVRIVCPVAERKFKGHIDIVTPFGFSGFAGNGCCGEFPHIWKEFAHRKGYVCGYVGLNPLFEDSTYFLEEECFCHNSIYVLDLTLPLDTLFANLSVNRRRQLKGWDQTLAHIILDKETLADFFIENYIGFFRRKDASSVYALSGDTLRALFSLDNVLLIGAGRPGNPEAVTVIAHTPFEGEYFFNVSRPEGRRHSVALLWYGLNYLKSLGVPVFNLGGGVRENDSLAEFKQRFGSRRLPLRCLKQIYRPEVYEQLCRAAAADHTDMKGYFPAYRSPGTVPDSGSAR